MMFHNSHARLQNFTESGDGAQEGGTWMMEKLCCSEQKLRRVDINTPSYRARACISPRNIRWRRAPAVMYECHEGSEPAFPLKIYFESGLAMIENMPPSRLHEKCPRAKSCTSSKRCAMSGGNSSRSFFYLRDGLIQPKTLGIDSAGYF